MAEPPVALTPREIADLLAATAMNVARLVAWFAERPRAATRPSSLAFLAA